MDFIQIIIAAYLFGSIPTAVWVGKAIKNIDVRDYGSGNAGATNTMRVLGYKIAIPVLLIDVAKGFAATQLASNTAFITSLTIESAIEAKLILGIVAVIGHIFPLFAGFRGGKGVATFFGVLIGIHPLSALISLILFVTVLAISKYVSLASILGAIFYPIQLLAIFGFNEQLVVVFSILIPVLVIITHRKNIARLLRGEESKINFAKR